MPLWFLPKKTDNAVTDNASLFSKFKFDNFSTSSTNKIASFDSTKGKVASPGFVPEAKSALSFKELGKYIFISYSTKNADIAQGFCAELKSQGVAVWMAPQSIPLGSSYGEAISAAVNDCAAVLVLLSPDSVESEWVKGEIERARVAKKPVFPVIIQKCTLGNELITYLERFQARDICGNPNGIKQIATEIKVALYSASKTTKVDEPANAELNVVGSKKTSMQCPMCGGKLKMLAVTDEYLECESCSYLCRDEKSDGVRTEMKIAYECIRNYDFARAEDTVDEILIHRPQHIEALWAKILIQYGVVYVRGFGKDATTVPTFLTYDDKQVPVTQTKFYKTIMAVGTKREKEYYSAKATELETVRSRIKKELAEDNIYDTFICTKISAATNDKPELTNKCEDYALAVELYKAIEATGKKPFLSEIDLQGSPEFDSEIFTALMHSKSIVVVCTQTEYIESVWVKSEWRRWLAMINAGKKGRLSFLLYTPSAEEKPFTLPRLLGKAQQVHTQDEVVSYVRKGLFGVSKNLGQLKADVDQGAIKLQNLCADKTFDLEKIEESFVTFVTDSNALRISLEEAEANKLDAQYQNVAITIKKRFLSRLDELAKTFKKTKKASEIKDLYSKLEELEDTNKRFFGEYEAFTTKYNQTTAAAKKVKAKRKRSIAALVILAVVLVLGAAAGVYFYLTNSAAAGKTRCEKLLEDGSVLTYAPIDNGNAYTVTGGEELHGDVVIKSEYNGKPVTAIDAQAFMDCDITSVIIPDTVTDIGANAFDGTHAVYIENNIKYVGIPTAESDFIKYEVTPKSAIWAVGYTDETLSTQTLTAFAAAEPYTLRIDTLGISRAAFKGLGISKITIPSSVKYINAEAFSEAPLLKEVYIKSETMPQIKQRAFENNGQLTVYLSANCYINNRTMLTESCPGVNAGVTSLTNNNVILVYEINGVFDSKQLAKNDNFPSIITDRIGYTFDGWFTDAELTKQYTPAQISDSIILYSKYTPNSYTITLVYDNGEQNTQTIGTTAAKIGELPLPEYAPFTFGGWYSGDTLFTADTIFKENNHITLTARWLGSAGLEFVDINSNCGVSKYTPQPGKTDIVIPETYQGKAVVAIGSVFSGTDITSIYISKNITAIAEDAFEGCTSLKTAYLCVHSLLGAEALALGGLTDCVNTIYTNDEAEAETLVGGYARCKQSDKTNYSRYCRHTYTDEYTCHDRACILCKENASATTAHTHYGAYSTKDDNQHTRTCGCGYEEITVHTYNVSYTCSNRTCSMCEYICIATTAHTYADEYTCHDRACTACLGGIITATTQHTGGTATCTAQAICTDCATAYGELLPHTYADEYTCHDRNCTVCNTKLAATTKHVDYGTYSSKNDTQHARTCACGYAQIANHTYIQSYTCNERACTKCGYICTATTAHTYADDYTCHNRYCTVCNGGLITATTKHAYYGEYNSKNDTQHTRICACGYVETTNHIFSESYTCKDKPCTKCGFNCIATSKHSGGTATCTEQAECTACGTAYGALQPHTYADEYTCHNRYCTVCNGGLIVASTEHADYGAYSSKNGTQHTRTCACGYIEATNHTYSESYTCKDKFCTSCGYNRAATTNHSGGTATCTKQAICSDCDTAYGALATHTYADQYTCHDRACTVCNEILSATTAHTLNNNCVCTVCGATAHTPNSDCICTVCGATAHIANGTYCRHDNTIYFGTYPQTEVTNTSLVSALTTAAGSTSTWTSYDYYDSSSTVDYMVYKDITYTDGNRYRGVYFTSYRPYCTAYSSSADNSIQPRNGYNTGTIYWFRYDPIKWDIMEEGGGYATILADLILDSQDYYYQAEYGTTRSRTDYQGNTAMVYDNNYQYSNIRTWLNENFYNTAFSSLQRSLIQVVTVDNSASTTKSSSSNQYACDSTNDKVWLLSYKEAFGTYFNSNSARVRQGTDYAKAQGLEVSSYSSNSGNSCWWLRSPYYSNSYNAINVGYDGYYDYYYVSNAYRGALPALKISLN